MDFDPLSDLPEAAKAGPGQWPGSWEFHGDLRGIYMGIDMGISMRNVDLLGIEWELMGINGIHMDLAGIYHGIDR